MFHRDSFSTTSFSEQSWKFDGVVPGVATGGFFYGLKGGRKRGQEVDEERIEEVAEQLLPIAKTNRSERIDVSRLLPSPVQAKSTLEGPGLPLAISFAFSADRRLTDDEAIALVLLMAEV